MSKSSKPSAPTKKSGVLKLVVLFLATMVLSIGATLFLAAPQVLQAFNPFAASHASTPEAQHAPPPPAPVDVSAPVFLELEPFTAMLRDGQNHRRVLYVGLTLSVDAQEDKALLTEYMPEVRDRILRMLSLQEPAELMPLEGRTRLAQELSSILTLPYHPRLPSPRIHKILFTAFVVH